MHYISHINDRLLLPMTYKTYSFVASMLFLVSACAAMKLQVTETHIFEPKESTAKIEHTFYLIGDAGNSTLKKDSPALKYLKEKTKNVSKKSTLIFLGDNVYEMGIPKKKKIKRKNDHYCYASSNVYQ